MDIVDELTDLSGAPANEVKAVADKAIKEIERLREELKNPVCDCPYLGDLIKKDDEIEKLREKNAQLRELLQKWLGNCFVDVYGNGVTFGMGVKKVWAETRDALKDGE